MVNVSLQIVSRKIDFEKKNIQGTDKKNIAVGQIGLCVASLACKIYSFVTKSI